MIHPKVAIIILNWNGRDDTLACLESVFEIDYPNYEVIVVDNGSSDDSVPAIRQRFPPVQLIETGENLGYAGGNNVGIEHALQSGSDYLFILNNDTTVAPDILKHLVAAAETYPDTAAFGPIVLEMERPDIIWTAGEHFAADGLSCVHHLQGSRLSELDGLDRQEWDWINGAAFFARAKVWREIGLFDSRFFLVYEESDWCFRARRAGYRCRVVPEARVWHKVAGSFGGEASPLRAYFSARNQLLFAEKKPDLGTATEAAAACPESPVPQNFPSTGDPPGHLVQTAILESAGCPVALAVAGATGDPAGHSGLCFPSLRRLPSPHPPTEPANPLMNAPGRSGSIPLDSRDMAEIQRLLKPFLQRFQARLILFGSRARGDARNVSDIDLAIRAEQPIPAWVMARMRECLEESKLPFRVDLVDYARAPEDLKRAIDEEGIPWPM